MPTKGGSEGNPRVIDRFDGGVGWIAYPQETMQRASHALAGEDGVYLVDPVHTDGVEDVYADLGEVTGVVVLLDRHKRDAAAIANRHDVPVYVPEWMRRAVESDLQAPVEGFEGTLPGTEYRVIELVNNPLWSEAALYDETGGTLVVAESLGTAEFFLAGGERLGVHPALRMFPPTELRGLSPDWVLVGHGTGVLDDAAAALRDALQGSRRRSPGLYAKALRSFLPI